MRITRPDQPEFDYLCGRLHDSASAVSSSSVASTIDASAWPAAQLADCAACGVFEWFLPRDCGGQEWSEADVARGYIGLARACLTTTFVITQRMGACTRIAGSDNHELARRLLPDLIAGRTFATVAISHLTTSRRHLGRPILRAERESNGYRLDGYSAWVTGADQAQQIVVGATLDDGRQILVALPTDLPGVATPPPEPLVALSASRTGRLTCEQVFVPDEWVLSGPSENVLRTGRGAGTGGLQTSLLALGLASAALAYFHREAQLRTELSPVAAALDGERRELEDDLLAASSGASNCSNESLRTRANSLVLRATQAALAAAKGTGFVDGHPAGRWCREALFFLVWSCPQPVLNANLCELAGLDA
ncbi:MAG TPA: acyl-CoA dehydrogenase family protein [Pirellulaceae bacterium]|nr:acyl-CoA dehydrogenase family protein [Pirellulaceae bacterium]